MRIRISAVILSLALATTTVLAAPAPVLPSTPDILAAAPSHLSHLQKRNLVTDKLKGLLQEALTSLECSACVAALVGVKDVAYLNKTWVLDAVNDLCPSLAKEPADVVSYLFFFLFSVGYIIHVQGSDPPRTFPTFSPLPSSCIFA